MMVPMTINPNGVRMWGALVDPGNPDVAVAIPTVIATVPGPITMLGGRRRNDFMRTFRWPNTNDNLGLGNTCGEQDTASDSEEGFLHRAILLITTKQLGHRFMDASCCGSRFICVI
jgi:hypothetical protein